eukprot:TRINITY_DN58_c0_g1_i16.p1 TRINITY_DN58_c0_g1~~TRINITY_DN58_c0_g1_i16.p1  ORF type:complete len:116 (-),score=19.38 TRINITY_DN58_c0_g1_i16:3-350(-)
MTLLICRPSMKNITVVFIVLERESTTTTTKGLLTRFLVADSSACISLSVWDERGPCLELGDIIQMKGSYVQMYHDSLVLYCGHMSTLERVGELVVLAVCLLTFLDSCYSSWGLRT